VDSERERERERQKHAKKLGLWEVVVMFVVSSQGRGEKLSTYTQFNPETQFNGQCSNRSARRFNIGHPVFPAKLPHTDRPAASDQPITSGHPNLARVANVLYVSAFCLALPGSCKASSRQASWW
jgi:hypothetical protein